MSCSLLQLVSTSKTKYNLINKPEITFFKWKIKGDYNNFSILNIIQRFNNIPNFNTKLTCNIDFNGDLIKNIFLVIDLPAIPKFNNNNSNNPSWSLYNNSINKIAWVENIGYNIIKNVELEIGSNLIEKFSGDFLLLQHNLFYKQTKKKSINCMIGNIDLLTNLSDYKDNYRLYVPLTFSLLKNDNFIPLISLKNTEVKIHIEFNNLLDCLILAPSHFIYIEKKFCVFKFNDIIYQKNYNNDLIINKFICFDDINNILYYLKIDDKKNFLIPFNDTDLENDIYKIFNELNDFVVPLKNSKEFSYLSDESFKNIFNLSLFDSFLLVDYIILPNIEKKKYDNYNIVIDNVIGYNEYIISSNFCNIPLNTNSLCKEILIIPQMTKIFNS